MSFLILENVSRSYQLGSTHVKAVANANLSVETGEFSAIWGPSGSGKSTLFNILATIDSPTKGKYIFDGQELSQYNDKALTNLRQKCIGIIFQSFNLIPVLTALENVMLPLQASGEAIKNLKARALHLLEEVGVAEYHNHKPNQLSGGQQQRVAIARALIANPKLVLADEPTANLDSVTSEKIIQLMSKINQEHGTTFLFSTHHDLLIQRASRKIHLSDGTIVSDERTEPSQPNLRNLEEESV